MRDKNNIAAYRRLGMLIFASWMIIIALYALWPNKADAYEFLHNGIAGSRKAPIELYINPAHCNGYIEQIEEWVKVIDYLIPVSYTVAGFTDAGKGYDLQWTIGCAPGHDLYTVHGRSAFTAGVAWTYTVGGIPIEVDILFQEDNDPKTCLVPHELLHSVGMAHSGSRDAIMKTNGCKGEYLMPDDLVGLAELYSVDANCAGYVTKDLEIFIPYYKGEWVLFEHLGNLEFAVVETGPSIDYEWSCHQEWSGFQQTLFTEILFQGDSYNIAMVHDDGIWELRLD